MSGGASGGKMETVDGRLIVISGASRSGKTAYVRQQVKKTKRILAYDPEDQWCRLPGWERITSKAQLFKLGQKPGPFKAGFVAGGDLASMFDFWCGIVMYAGRYIEPVTAIAEELSDVTKPSKAPGNWGILLRRGLKRGISIYAISQRWAEADKTAIGNASEFVIFRCTGDDGAYMARKTNVPEEEIASFVILQYVKKDAYNGQITRGKLKF